MYALRCSRKVDSDLLKDSAETASGGKKVYAICYYDERVGRKAKTKYLVCYLKRFLEKFWLPAKHSANQSFSDGMILHERVLLVGKPLGIVRA